MTAFGSSIREHPETGWQLINLAVEGDKPDQTTEMSFAPGMGSNMLSFVVDGREYLYGTGSRQGEVRLLGTPILYPSPNRVRNATFAFDGRTFRFEPNDGTNFLHGLVRDQAWEWDEPEVGPDRVSATSRTRFGPASALYALYPIRNTLELTYVLTPGQVRFEFTVRNEDQTARLPFGLAIHPYFRIHGARDEVRLHVPAERWMEAEKLLPTGRLVAMEDGPADLRRPTPLSELDLDDVFWGLDQSRPQVITYDALSKRITLRADSYFGHSVVYTPPTMPFFCVENQSCSTDAHNLHAQGLIDESRLTILEPGESLNAWIEMTVEDM